MTFHSLGLKIIGSATGSTPHVPAWARKEHLALAKLGEIVDEGVTYQKIDGQSYEQHLFDKDDAEEITAYASRLYEVQNKGKALYNFITNRI